MSPIEHYFENLLYVGSDIKGEPNKNALSKEVQEAIEECAYYIKYSNHTKIDMIAMLTELKEQLREMHEDFFETEHFDEAYGISVSMDLIGQKIDKLKENTDDV